VTAAPDVPGPAVPGPLRAFRQSLRVKVIALIVAILILGFGTLMVVNIRREAATLVLGHQETVRLLSGAILAAIENGMLEGRPDIIRQLVSELKAQLKDVRRIDVYRRNGVEAFTDLETVDEVNRIAGLEPSLIDRITKMKREPGARIDHPLFAEAVRQIEPQAFEESVGGSRYLTLFRPLRNLDKCHECHGMDHKVRGVVRISLGLEKLDAELQAARWRQVAIAVLTILGAAGVLVVSMGRLVLRPIGEVAAAARRIGSGDFAARVPAESPDEIGQLGRVINDMAGRLSTAHAEVEARNAELATALASLQESLQKVQLLEQLKGELSKFVPESSRSARPTSPSCSWTSRATRACPSSSRPSG
jgi:HAMP domain-containing protein